MPPGRRFGKYLLHEKLAVGGMGELYLATVAGAAKGTPPSVLKILLPEYSADADFVSMFHDEARIGMQLAHPNIVAVTDLGRVADTPFIVLEYVHGENAKNLLRAVQDRGEKFPPELAVRIGIEALHGLDHAHNAKDARGKPINLVHRDLSPDNIMVSFEGDVKLLDFGIAKAEGRATQTQFGILKGKAQYMAPEQAIGADVDARTDLYAVGLVLLEIITGERRFSADTDPVQQIRDARVWKARGPSERDPTLPVELDAILLKALQPDPRRRWQTAEEYAIALTRLLRDGRLPRSSENLPRFLRRLFPGRAEPFLGEDPTENSEVSVLVHTGEISLPDPIPALTPARARANNSLGAAASPTDASASAGEATAEGRAFEPTRPGAPADALDTTNPGARPELEPTRPGSPDLEATQAAMPLAARNAASSRGSGATPEPTVETPRARSSNENENRTVIQPGRRLPAEPDDRPTIPPEKTGPKPLAPAKRLGPTGDDGTARVAMRRSGGLKAAVEDPRDEGLEGVEDFLGDGTRVGDLGGGTRVMGGRAIARSTDGFDPEARTNRGRDDEDTFSGPPPEARERGRYADGRDPSASERRAAASRRPPPRRESGRPSFFLLFVLTIALLMVASAAGALVFKDDLPPPLRARVEAALASRRPRGRPAATSTPAAGASPGAASTAIAEASPMASGTEDVAAGETATPASSGTPGATPRGPVPSSTLQVAIGGGVFPSDDATPAPNATASAAATATATAFAVASPTPRKATTAVPVLTPVRTPRANPTPAIARATPRETPPALSMAKGKASVRIISKPEGFEILVDGVGTGKRTPATVLVDPGIHTLSLDAKGYRPWSFPEEFHAGDTLQLPADLIPIPPPQ